MEAILGGMAEGVLVVNTRATSSSPTTPPGGCCVCRTSRRAATISRSSAIRTSPRRSAPRSRGGEEAQRLELALPHGAHRDGPERAGRAERATGAVVVLHDITDLRRADRVRRDFVANVSHELRTPLTAIRGYVEALLDGRAEGRATRRFLEIISRHSLRMERLVRDLLRLARLDAGQERREHVACPVEQPVRRRGGRARRADRIEARRGRSGHRARRRRPSRRSRGKLHDVFRNLVENAVNYSPEARDDRDGLRDATGARLLLTVADQGRGIPEADLPRIFERFYRVDKARSRSAIPAGPGLGLSIVKHLVELHGGRVSAANRPDGGAIFTVSCRPTDA